MIPMLLFILLVFLLAVSAFLALAETSFIGINKIRLRNMVNQGIHKAKIVQDIILRVDDFLVAILISNNFVNITISVIGTAIFIHLFGDRPFTVVIATLVITTIVLIFGEITPKIIAARHAEQIALNIAQAVKYLLKLSRPLTNLVPKWEQKETHLLGDAHKKHIPLLTEEEIKMMIDVAKQDGVVHEDEKKMLYRIFKFGDMEVKDTMIPVEEIASLKLNAPIQELMELWDKEGCSKIPVYLDTIDNIKGIIYARNIPDILQKQKTAISEDMLSPVYFVEPQRKIMQLLNDFQKMRTHIAIVVQDNKTIGLVTLEDLMEEIVGELEEADVRKKD